MSNRDGTVNYPGAKAGLKVGAPAPALLGGIAPTPGRLIG